MFSMLIPVTSLATIVGLLFMIVVVLALLTIIVLQVLSRAERNDPNFVKNGGLIGVVFRRLKGRNPTLGEQALILLPVMLIVLWFWI